MQVPGGSVAYSVYTDDYVAKRASDGKTKTFKTEKEARQWLTSKATDRRAAAHRALDALLAKRDGKDVLR